MPEIPDFDQIAKRIASAHADQWDEDADGNQVQVISEAALGEDIALVLHEVWTARGDADLVMFKALEARVVYLEEQLRQARSQHR